MKIPGFRFAMAFLLSTLLLSCANQQAEKKDTVTGTNPDNVHSSRNSLDWTGVYKGVLPCDDCPGIKTTVILKEGNRYIRKIKYEGNNGQIYSDSSQFIWNDAGSVITLKGEEAGNQRYKVVENALLHLDGDGNPVTGELAAKYRLQKNRSDKRIEGRKWILAEIMGEIISPGGTSKEPFLIFLPESETVRGNGSCNHFSGSYELGKNNRINVTRVVATHSACPEITTEYAFLEVLDKADNYHVTDSTLFLLKGSKTPLARFIAFTPFLQSSDKKPPVH